VTYALLGIAGLIAGTFSALLGVGGGVILVPAMQYLGVPFKVAVGTSLAVIIPTALTGVVRHYSFGNVDFKVAAIMVVGAVLGANIGAALLKYVPELAAKRLFALFMVYVAYRLFCGK
jgi:uncharacterized membrane protein YfcA